MFWYSFRILPDRLKLIRLYPCGSLSFSFGAWAGHFCIDSPEWRSAHYVHMILTSWWRFQYDRKCPFSCIYNPQITISPPSSFSASFNGNCVKYHPKPWTCPLKPGVARSECSHAACFAHCQEFLPCVYSAPPPPPPNTHTHTHTHTHTQCFLFSAWSS